MSAVVRAGLVVIGILLMVVGLAIIGGLPGARDHRAPGLRVRGVPRGGRRNRAQRDTGPNAAEKSNAAPGPGGGEPGGQLEPRFRMTAEVFIDPTSGHRMRVLVDPASGERRYVAEG